MEQTKGSVKKVALSYGLILALLSIVLSVIAYVLGVHIERPWWVSVLGIGIMILIIIYGLKTFKKDNGGFLSLGEALKVGLAISLVSAIIVVIYNYIFITFIEPDLVAQTLEYTREQMIEQNPDMPEEQMEMALGFTEKMMSPAIMSAIGIIFSLFLGFIISLIGGLVMKQNRPEHA